LGQLPWEIGILNSTEKTKNCFTPEPIARKNGILIWVQIIKIETFCKRCLGQEFWRMLPPTKTFLINRQGLMLIITLIQHKIIRQIILQSWLPPQKIMDRTVILIYYLFFDFLVIHIFLRLNTIKRIINFYQKFKKICKRTSKKLIINRKTLKKN